MSIGENVRAADELQLLSDVAVLLRLLPIGPLGDGCHVQLAVLMEGDAGRLVNGLLPVGEPQLDPPVVHPGTLDGPAREAEARVSLLAILQPGTALEPLLHKGALSTALAVLV